MSQPSTSGVLLKKVTDLGVTDVSVPENRIYYIECHASPKPGNKLGLTSDIAVYALVSASPSELDDMQRSLDSGERFNLAVLDRLYMKPEYPMSDKEIGDVIFARRLLRFDPG